MSGDEVVGLYDEQGHEVGRATRARVRAENLRHAATAIVLRNTAGEVYVHRRTDTKDIYPGLHDFAAGGVMQAGETPLESATRELGEELGVHGVPLHPVGEANYADATNTYHAFLFTATWDGPITHQAEEVASGGWWTVSDLAGRVADDPGMFVPDSVALWNPTFDAPA